MRDREYGIWIFDPSGNSEPQIIPAASSKYWATRAAAKRAEDPTLIVKVVYRYTFMPDLPWEDA